MPAVLGFAARMDFDGVTQQHAANFDAAGFAAILYGPRFTPGSVRALAIFGDAGRPNPPRPADPVPDWKSKLRSPKRRRVTRRKAKVIDP